MAAAAAGMVMTGCIAPETQETTETAAPTPGGNCYIVRLPAADSEAVTVELRCGKVRWDATKFTTSGTFQITSSTIEGWTLERARTGPVIGKDERGTAVVLNLRNRDGQKCEVFAHFWETSEPRQTARSECPRFNSLRETPV